MSPLIIEIISEDRARLAKVLSERGGIIGKYEELFLQIALPVYGLPLTIVEYVS